MKQVGISLLLLFLINVSVFSEIAIGTILTIRNYEYEELVITNKDTILLPNKSGLKIFAGDSIQSSNDQLILLVPTSSLVITINKYSNLQFDIQELGGREYILKIIISDGSLRVEKQPREDLLQVLSDVALPEIIQRKDNLIDTSSSALKLYVQFVNNGNATIDNKGLDISSGVFFTNEEMDLRAIMNVLKNNLMNTDEKLQNALTPPNFEDPFFWDQSLRINAYFQDWEKFSFLTGKYILSMQKGKFKSAFTFPLFFTQNNYLYHPPGLNDMMFGFQLFEEQYQDNTVLANVGIGTQSALYGLLNKIEEINYGLASDTMHVYYGKQRILHNRNSTLFMDHYKPYKTFANNFNKDFILGFNLNNFGSSIYVRAFQNASMYDSMLSNVDILYGRIWYKPMLPVYDLEIGATAAIDMAMNKYSAYDEYFFVKQDNNSANKLMFAGVDSTVPIINNVRYALDINAEVGYILPINSTWQGIINYAAFTNYGAKAGVSNTLISNRSVFTTNIFANVYYTSGFFRPHFATSGYEYYIKPLYNRLISTYKDDKEHLDFSAKALTPEAGFTINHNIFTVGFGAYYPIALSGDITKMYQYPSGYIASTVNLDNINSKVFTLTFNLFYSIPMFYIDMMDVITVNTSNILVQFGPMHSVYDVNTELVLFEKYGIELGIFNTPQYNGTELSILEDTTLPQLVGMAYATVFVKL